MTQQEYLTEKYIYTNGRLTIAKSRSKDLIGIEVGSIEKNSGYYRFQLYDYRNINVAPKMQEMGFPKQMFLHRAIWIIHNGDIPEGMQIDHIDQNKLNNTIENLRMVTGQENQRNRKLDARNKSGLTGIRKRTRKNSVVYEVSTKALGQYIYIGTYKTIEEAKTARDLYYDANGFHENHK